MTGEQGRSSAPNVQNIVSAIKTLLPGIEEGDITDIELLVQRADDPFILATLIAALIEERRRTNALLREIRDALRSLSSSPSAPPTVEEDLGLSEADERILSLIRERGAVCAEDVREALGYKGLNAASARLNSLYKRGILRKIRRGRKVYFTLAP